MTEELLDIDKKTLQEIYTRLLRTNSDYKYLQLRFLWDYIHETKCFSQICEMLKKKKTLCENQAERIVDIRPTPTIALPNVYLERINLTYFIIDHILKSNIVKDGIPQTKHGIDTMYAIGKYYDTKSDKEKSQEKYFELFNDLFLEPFVYFILHHASRHFLVLGLFKKYKHRSEWFNRELLHNLAKKKATIKNSDRVKKRINLKTEKNLLSNLHKFLFDQELTIFIEPSSHSGEIDFIGWQKDSSNKLIAEAKVFDGVNRGKPYIIAGLGQLLPHIAENNENEGFLIIYNICQKILSFKFENNSEGFPYCMLDNKRIYFVVIDVCAHRKTASGRGSSKIIEITYNDLKDKKKKRATKKLTN
jgi:hypothetical protein